MKKTLACILTLVLLFSMGLSALGETTDLSQQEPLTLEVYALTFRSEPSPRVEAVQNAVNAYIKPLLNTEIHLNIIPYAAYQQQLTLLASSNEQADLIMGAGE